ncbi:MAG: acyloxyacyl hydrolase [Flavobacteriales bacterium]|nr:acyloxyacyl hydrolase [Flavobacteriales bacterium]
MRCLASLLLGSLGLLAAAQQSDAPPLRQPWSLGARAHYGFLWPHRPSSWILVEGHASALELFAERRVQGDRPWHHQYALPTYGVGVLYTGLANPDRVGGCVRVLPYLFLPFRQQAKGGFGMRVGWGVGYVTKPYDRRENPQQIAIGSRINTAIQIMPEYRMQRGPWSLMAGVGVDHWSNGSYQLPNLGLNYLSASFGAAYALGERSAADPLPPQEEPISKRPEYSVVAAFGMNESGSPLSGQYTAYSLSGQAQWRVSRKSGISAGMDLFNKGSLASKYPELAAQDRITYTQIALHGGYALLFGRGELFMHMGPYIYTPEPEDAAVFHRVGMRYRSGGHMVWNISLKSHYAVADHWEFGVGYRW